MKRRAIELSGVISAWRSHVDDDECRRTVCCWRMIGQAPLAKKSNNRLVDVWLKVRGVERWRVIAAAHVINADDRIDLTQPRDVATKHSACAKLAKCAWQ